jgi:hypothetical protein
MSAMQAAKHAGSDTRESEMEAHMTRHSSSKIHLLQLMGNATAHHVPYPEVAYQVMILLVQKLSQNGKSTTQKKFERARLADP